MILESRTMQTERFLRTFAILDLLSASREGLRLSQISQQLDVPLSSTHNLLKTMVDAELLTASEEGRYLIGPRAARLGIKLSNGIEVRESARRHLQALVQEVGFDVYLAMRIGDSVLYVDRYKGRHPVSVDIRLGRKLYLHATSAGKLFAAHHSDLRESLLSEPLPQVTPKTITDMTELRRALDEIARDGYALSRSEGAEGVTGIAVPVRDAAGTVSAAIHISLIQSGADASSEEHLLASASAAARAIEREIGWLAPEQL
jgi:DNA-binding IclR family transcriptional regulator